jgi:ATP-dependent DNA helicase RecQ
MVFPDSALNALVLARPTSISALLQVSGIGPRIADTHGASITALCRSEALPESPAPTSGLKLSSHKSASSAPVQHKSSPVLLSNNQKESSSRPKAPHFASEAESPLHSARSTVQSSTETFTRPRATTPEPTDSLTPEQQALDQRLRDWRKTESERLGLPLFFVLATTTLRSIVLTRPQNFTELKAIHGLGLEKAEKFGPGILEICRS